MIVGGESLDGVGLELVVALKCFVEADELDRLKLHHFVKKLLGDFIFEADKEAVMLNRKNSCIGDRLFNDGLAKIKARLQKNFKQNGLRGSLRVNVIRMKLQLFFNVGDRNFSIYISPIQETRGIEREVPKS